MTTFVASAAFDMQDFATNGSLLDFFESGEVVTGTATELVVAFTDGAVTETLTLTGNFADYADGYPTAGTISTISFAVDGGTIFTLSNVDITIEQFTAFALADDLDGLFESLLAGADLLTGSSGNDVLVGYAGNDTLSGGGGTDIFHGGAGDDVYHVEGVVTEVDGGYSFTGLDQAVELADAGNDTVNSDISYTLGANVENLNLLGSLHLSGFGNALDNHIVGNSGGNFLMGGAGDDFLDGGAGADFLDGGIGSDTYVVDDANDNLTIESPAEEGGVDTVLSSITFNLDMGFENLTLTGNAAINGTGTHLDNELRGNAAANVLSGMGGNDLIIGGAGGDTLNGEFGDDTLEGGEGQDQLSAGAGADVLFGGAGADTLSGGSGADTFIGLAADLDGDTITDLTVGDSLIITDADLATFTYALSGSTLTYSGGSLALAGALNGRLVASAAAEGGVQLAVEPITRAKLILTESGQDFTIGGDIAVTGTLGGGEVIEIVRGDVTLDASFNAGGDTVVLPGNAASYTASVSGSFVTITGGDITVAIPVGTAGLVVDFADGAHTLRFDAEAGQVLIGDQVVGAAPAPVAPTSAPVTVVDETEWEGMPAPLGRLILTAPGQDVDIGGNVHLVGTAEGGEVVTVLGGTVQLDASFNTGGDTIVLPGASGGYTADLAGSFVTIASGEASVAIPVGIAGTTVEFGDASAVLRFDPESGQVLLGDYVVTSNSGTVAATPTIAGNVSDPGAQHYEQLIEFNPVDINDSFSFA